jgi:outer membrane protein assembly factor BamE (lipoprotein component of BamABCDE complex)
MGACRVPVRVCAYFAGHRPREHSYLLAAATANSRVNHSPVALPDAASPDKRNGKAPSRMILKIAPRTAVTRTPLTSRSHRLVHVLSRICLAAGLVIAAGCTETVTKHGQLFRDSDLQQIQPGMMQEQVKLSLGTPTTTTTTGSGQVYYYISSTMSQKAFFTPEEKDRKVVAVYFNQTGMVERVANYGLKDGKVFDFVSRTTPAPGGNEDGILKQLFRNLGQRQIFGE